MANSRSLMKLISRQLTNNVKLLSQSNSPSVNHRWLSGATQLRQNNTTVTSEDTTSSKNSKTESASQQPHNEKENNTPSPEQELHKQIDQLTKDLADMKDKYQRALADRENVRLRLEKQVTDAKLYGIQGFCKDLLEVSDVFRKALDSVPEAEVDSGTDQLRSLYNGISMTETQLLSVFRRHGLASMSLEPGSKFDPGWQEAMFEVPSTGEEQHPGTVAHVLRDGWKLHDRCIRSAQVGVYKE